MDFYSQKKSKISIYFIIYTTVDESNLSVYRKRVKVSLIFCHVICIYIFICFEGLKESKLPEGGINVFSALLHTHLAGKF